MFSKIAAPFLFYGYRLKTRLYSAAIAGQFREFGAGCRVVPPLRFGNLRPVRLGEGAMISPNCWINVEGPQDDQSIKIDIGKFCGIGMGATISAAKSIVLGNYVLLARNVYISDHRHAFEDISRPIMYQGITGILPVSIGCKSWLGQNVVVLPGATIGEHCVIGANSVVRGNIPDYCVAVGTPAKIIRRYNHQTKIWERV